MSLKPAHQGYRYQDIATAYFLVRAVVEDCDRVTVDRKQVEDDRIDDLEVDCRGRLIRRQFKSSVNPARQLASTDFFAERSTLRIDRLVLTHTRADSDVAEYRLCATWQPPSHDHELRTFLIGVQAEPTFIGTNPALYRLRADQIWPEGAQPVWPVLQPYHATGAEFGSRSLSSFAGYF